MYAGPGSGSLLAAAGSWDSVSAELSITAAVYESVLSGLTNLYWHGPASQAMAASAAPYVGWLYATAERAQQTAMQARTAAAAYELARAMTVPPPVVAANRTQLATLVATNFFGQNTAAIAANEAQYADFWAQDASAMYSYSASSTAAVQFSPFSAPRQATDPDGVSAQSAAVAQADASTTGSNAGAQAAPGASEIPLDFASLTPSWAPRSPSDHCSRRRDSTPESSRPTRTWAFCRISPRFRPRSPRFLRSAAPRPVWGTSMRRWPAPAGSARCRCPRVGPPRQVTPSRRCKAAGGPGCRRPRSSPAPGPPRASLAYPEGRFGGHRLWCPATAFASRS